MKQNLKKYVTTQISANWLWLKIKQEGLRRFWSMFPLTRVPLWYRFFEPQPIRGLGGLEPFFQQLDLAQLTWKPNWEPCG